jgi:nitroreductase
VQRTGVFTHLLQHIILGLMRLHETQSAIISHTMNTQEALTWRYATKKFDPQKILTEEQVSLILEALRMAPSSYGLQPWRFYLIENPELRKDVRALAWNQSQVTDASHLIAIATLTEATESDVLRYAEELKRARGVSDTDIAGYRDMMLGTVRSLTPEQGGAWHARQGYLALGFLLAVLAHNGIDACPMEGFEADKVSELLGSTADSYRVLALVPVGFRAEDDAFATLPKVRYPVEEAVRRV